MEKRKGILFGFVVLLIAAIFTMAGCEDPTDPVTGKPLLTGSLMVVNQDNTTIEAVRLTENNNLSKVVWEAQDLGAEKGSISQGQSKSWSGIPAGNWRIQVKGYYLNNVDISTGWTTVVTLQSGGSLIAGDPLPLP
jgi:hypothetical protein